MSAVLLGGAIGFYAGGTVCSAILGFEGKGNSHADAIPAAASGAIGLLVGAVSLPITVWSLISRRYK
jgi:hypothetical protein